MDNEKNELSPLQYDVCWNKATERPFTGRWLNNKESGTYYCVACNAPLFSSTTKYDSGSGWPSFYQPIGAQAVREVEDLSHGMRRVEVVCRHCSAHLGHVFEDGPAPTGLRFCINSASLDFKKEDA